MINHKLIKAPTSDRKTRAVRFYAVLYFTLVMTLLAPISTAHSPVFNMPNAIAENTDYKSYARAMGVYKYNWDSEQFICLGKLWGKESAWNHEAQSPTHDYGIPQRHMSRNTQKEIDKFLNDPINQIIWGLGYIEHRYGSPCKAWQFHEMRNWY